MGQLLEFYHRIKIFPQMITFIDFSFRDEILFDLLRTNFKKSVITVASECLELHSGSYPTH